MYRPLGLFRLSAYPQQDLPSSGRRVFHLSQSGLVNAIKSLDDPCSHLRHLPMKTDDCRIGMKGFSKPSSGDRIVSLRRRFHVLARDYNKS